ncbi:hypothetical protein K3556_14765 [Aliiroseovarius sp. M344]|uniref:hypothetical protein n=1 Tax=Aliiroseovarius sp. M344 TaxID=2867010 RepID=UPI0021AD95CF|nr:hypothetical protein [Aliiroseovarius sp. M344]UWQ14151.1 hypothetical protein K3556_14765 [Aliiroseovarius sp. M344]
MCGFESPKDIQNSTKALKLDNELSWILDRIEDINGDECEDARHELDDWVRDWRQYAPPAWGKMAGGVDEASLMLPFGAPADDQLLQAAWPVMTSMRNVDGSSSASVLSIYPEPDM